MAADLFKIFRRDRRGATALIVALMIVPLILMCGAAVDFSRVSSARAQLQAAVDAAAVVGDGTYQADQSSGNAQTAAASAFASSVINLTAYSAVAAPVVTAVCTTSTSAACTANNANYSVTVTASATLKNSLLGAWIPSEALSATAISASSVTPIGNGSCPTNSRCVLTAGTVRLSPGGSGSGEIFSADHLSGTGAPESDPPSNNPGGGVEPFNVFLNGDNSAVPGTTAYVSPQLQNSADPCSSTQRMLSQTIKPSGMIIDAYGNQVSCAFNGVCNLPAGTYCGTLTIGANVNLTITTTMSNPGVFIEDGNLLVSPGATIACTAATGYAAPPGTSNCASGNIASQFVPIFFGGTNTGSIIMEQTNTIDPSQISSGDIEYISTFNSVNTQNNGVTTNIQAGVCQDAASYCDSGAVGGPMVIVFNNAGTITYNDTYITHITIYKGVESHWKQTEILATKFQDSSGNIINTCTTLTDNTPSHPCIYTQTVTYEGDQAINSSGNPADSNLASSSTQTASYDPSTIMPSSTLTCSTGTSLYFDTTTTGSGSGTGSGANPNLGYSYASQNISGDGLLAETTQICGVGTALASNGSNGTGTTVGPSGTSTSPILIY